VGFNGASAANYALAADKSLPIEFDDLSKIWVKNSVAGEKIHIFGTYKN
jgi:hypothetical protein